MIKNNLKQIALCRPQTSYMRREQGSKEVTRATPEKEKEQAT